jgi:hypothetical protein
MLPLRPNLFGKEWIVEIEVGSQTFIFSCVVAAVMNERRMHYQDFASSKFKLNRRAQFVCETFSYEFS